MKKYTVIAVRTQTGVIGINRRKPPFRGMWNLIGGKVEPGETERHGAMRETFEETGIELPEGQFDFVGTMDWVVDRQPLGIMYLYVTDAPQAIRLPRDTREGLLAILDSKWMTLPDNQGIVPDTKLLLPRMLSEHDLQLVAQYRGDNLINVMDR